MISKKYSVESKRISKCVVSNNCFTVKDKTSKLFILVCFKISPIAFCDRLCWITFSRFNCIHYLEVVWKCVAKNIINILCSNNVEI